MTALSGWDFLRGSNLVSKPPLVVGRHLVFKAKAELEKQIGVSQVRIPKSLVL